MIKRTKILRNVFLICIGLFYVSTGIAQQLDPLLVNYPDTIFINGNVVSMDDDGVNENVGSTYQALAVRDGRILSLGTTEYIRNLAGPDTTVYDANGRTIIPGIIDTHSHPPEYAEDHWGPPRDGDYDIQADEDDTWEDIALKTIDLVKELKEKYEPDFWLFINWPRNIPSSNMQKDTALRVHRVLTRHMLDEVNSEQNIYITGNRGVMNTRGMETYSSYFGGEEYPDMFLDDGITLSGSVGRVVRGETTPIPLFMNIIEQEFREWTAFGVTTFGSRIGLFNQTAAIKALDRDGRMPLRYAYALDSYWFRTMPGHTSFRTDMSGTGSDWLWENSVSISSGDGAYPLLATTIEARPEIKERELLRDRVSYIKDYTANGLRWANTHIAGDRTLDAAMDMIESGSAEAGLSDDEVRAKRHGSDHCRMNPRPDQLPRLKKLGVTMSCAPKYIVGDGPRIIDDYGEQYLHWLVPMRTTIEGGVRAVFEIDTHAVAGEGVFYHISQYVNRLGRNGEVYAPEQRINRIWALKTATSWASYYVLKEDKLGSLEQGKFADLLVLNKNYFDENTVPDSMIKTVRPLMTVIGGHIRYLDPGLASEYRTQPVGIQPEQLIRQLQQWESE